MSKSSNKAATSSRQTVSSARLAEAVDRARNIFAERNLRFTDLRAQVFAEIAATNGAIVGASSEGYKAKSDCEANMNRGAVPTDKWEFYQDKKGEWRWRRFAQNGRQVGRSSEGYKSRGDAEANAGRFGWAG